MTAQTILPANTLSSGSYDVANSLRFDTASDDYLNRTVGTPTQSLKYTISAWVKRSVQSTNVNSAILGIGNSGSSNAALRFKTDDTLQFYDHVSNADQVNYITNRVFRDNSAWYHVVVSSDRSLGSPETKIFINGVQETSFGTSTEYNQNDGANWNTNGKVLYVGSYNASYDHIDGYLAEVVFADGQILAPDQFGEFDEDSGIWKPIKVSGLTFGDEGFYLEFKGSGTSANSSGLGADTSGNDHHFTVNNLTALDQSTDTCTNNFCTFTSTDPTASAWALSEGNLKCQRTTGTSILFGTSIMPTTGKWYFEVKIGEAGNSDRSRVGVMNYQSVIDNSNYTGVINTPSQVFKGVTTSCKVGKHFEGTGSGVTEYTASGDFADDDIVQFALDLDNKAIYIGRNGTFLTQTGNSGGDPTSGASKTGAISTNTTIFDGSPMTVCTGLSVGSGTDTSTMFFNFGSPPYAISSGNADADGHGNFEFAVPSGYFALCSKNLAEYG